MQYSEERNKKISKSKTKSFSSIVKRIYDINNNITILETADSYINTKHKIHVKCNICGYEYYPRPNAILTQHTGCPACKKNLKYTNETFDNKLKQLNILNIERLDNYINNNSPIRFKCKECNYIWKTKPLHILNGRRCPHCKQSTLEYLVERKLLKYNIKFENEKTFEWLKNKGHMYLDFYLPDYNIAIECHGIQHFEPIQYHNKNNDDITKNFKDILERDDIKYNLCIEHGIQIYYFSTLNKEYRYKLYNNIDILIEDIIKNNQINLKQFKYINYNLI